MSEVLDIEKKVKKINHPRQMMFIGGALYALFIGLVSGQIITSRGNERPDLWKIMQDPDNSHVLNDLSVEQLSAFADVYKYIGPEMAIGHGRANLGGEMSVVSCDGSNCYEYKASYAAMPDIRPDLSIEIQCGFSRDALEQMKALLAEIGVDQEIQSGSISLSFAEDNWDTKPAVPTMEIRYRLFKEIIDGKISPNNIQEVPVIDITALFQSGFPTEYTSDYNSSFHLTQSSAQELFEKFHALNRTCSFDTDQTKEGPRDFIGLHSKVRRIKT